MLTDENGVARPPEPPYFACRIALIWFREISAARCRERCTSGKAGLRLRLDPDSEYGNVIDNNTLFI
jgi:hypothetical protein